MLCVFGLTGLPSFFGFVTPLSVFLALPFLLNGN